MSAVCRSPKASRGLAVVLAAALSWVSVQAQPVGAQSVAPQSANAQPATVAAKVPEVHGTSFADQPINLPHDLQGKVGVLVLGFTQGSRDAVTAWGKRLTADYFSSQSVQYYEMPVLASVPRFMRGFVTGKIKGAVSDRAKPRFVPITENETGWRTLTHYDRGDDAYLVLVDGTGAVLWQTHGAFEEASYTAMKAHLEEFRSAIAHSGQ